MSVNQQQSTDNTAVRATAVRVLQSSVHQKSFSNNSMGSDTNKSDVADIRILKRSKRQKSTALAKSLCKISKSSRAKLSIVDNVPVLNILSGVMKGTLESGEIDFLDCDNIPFEELREILAEAFNGVSDELQDFSKQAAKNYWAIDKNHGLLFTNHGLLLANTGLLIGVAFMLMNITMKIDRNYEAILRLEAKVDRNYDAIRRVESKVDRNLEVMLSRFKMLEYNLTNAIERKFKEVIDFVRQTRIEGVTSELIIFMRHFMQEKESIRNLTHDQYVTKLEEVNGILHRLKNSRMPQPGTLHTLLYNIINQRFAIPENSDDRVSLAALGLLCSGTETYISVMSFLLEEYSYLANFYYKQNDLEKYNDYFSLISTTFNDFKHSLMGDNGLIDEVIRILSEVKLYDFIKDEREDVVEFASKRLDSLNLAKSKLATANNLSQEKSREKIKYHFSNSQIKTPIGNWEDRRKVSYAIQFQSSGTSYRVGEWSTPARIYQKANPLLDIGAEPGGKTRLIFRKFDNAGPELVGVVEDGNQREFRDISRDFYNAVLEPNEDVAIAEMEVFLANGADINARYERGRQAIHAAAENGNPNIMLTLKNRGADINAKDTNGYAPIHIAAGDGYENFIKDLVGSGADVNAKTTSGRTALHIAAENGHVNTVTNLVQVEGIAVNAKDRRGFTPLHTAASFGKSNVIAYLCRDNRTEINAQSEVGFTPLHLAAIGEYDDAVKALLRSNRVDVNAKTQSGLTALHFASLVGSLEVAKPIMEDERADINEKSADGWTPLHLAINSKQEHVASELLSIDNIEINAKGKDDLTPLHLAASSKQKNIVSKLLDKDASIESVDKYGYTPLHFAIESGDLDVVRCLVERSANPYAERKDGYTPLGLAAYNGESDIVRFLVNDKGINVNDENKNGMTPIDFAASNGYFDIVEFLIDKGANKESALHWAAYGGQLNIVKYLVDEKHFDSNEKDKYGNMPVHNAALQGHLNVVKYFVDVKQVDLNTETNNGYTPFLFAALGGKLDVIKYFIDEKNVDLNSSPNMRDDSGSTELHLAAVNSNLAVIKYLVRKEASVNIIDNYGNTPLFVATSRGHLNMVKYLIQKGANFEITNNYSNTPLHFAVWNGHLDIVKYFAEKGAQLNATNKNGDTPLHLAAASGNLDIVKYLLEQGINIHTRVVKSNEKSNNGKTALHLAAQNGRLDVVEYLITKGADMISRDDSGKLPRDLANQNNHRAVVKFLEEAQLNLSLLNAVKQGNLNKAKEYFNQGASLEVKDKKGETLEEIAHRNANIEIADFLKQKELDLSLVNAVKQGNLELVKECIAGGADLEAKDKDGHNLPYLAAQNYDIEPFLMQAQLDLDLMNAVEQDNLDRVKYISREASLETKDKNDNTLLHLAACGGQVDTAKYLVSEGADFNAVNKDNSTPLHAAALNGKLNTIKYFIEELGANLEVRDKNGNTPLSLAARHSDLDTVKYLVEKGANLSSTNADDSTPLHLAASLEVIKYFVEKGANLNAVNRNGFTLFHVAAATGMMDVIKYLVEEKEANLEVKDGVGNTPLILAAQNCHLGTVKYLVGKGADTSALGGYLDAVRTIIDERFSDVQDSDGNTSLHSAASSGYLGIVKCLVSSGANVEATNKNGQTSLHVAAGKGYLDIVEYLVEKGVDLSATDNRDANPLHLAVANNKLDVTKCLVEKGANVHARMLVGNDGKTVLHLAVENSSLDSIKYLISEGADLMATNKDGYTPIHYSASMDVIKYFVERRSGTDKGFLDIASSIVDGRPVDTQDDDGNTSLHLAASNGYIGIVKYLVEKGAGLYTVDKDGYMPLHLAALNGHPDIVKYFINKGVTINIKDTTTEGKKPIHIAAQGGHKNVLEFLLSVGAVVDDTDSNGRTPLHYASNCGQLEAVKFLADKSADVNAEDSTTEGKKPIHAAARGGHKHVIEFLLGRGVGVADIDKKGWTPLHHAAKCGQLEAVAFLIEKGADLQAQNQKNEKLTPLHLAAEEGNLDVVKYLIKKGADVHALSDYLWEPRFVRTIPLHLAAKRGQLDVLKYLVEKGGTTRLDYYSKSPPERYGASPLLLAVQYGHLEAVKYLAEQGAYINPFFTSNTGRFGCTALQEAISSNRLDIVKYLVENGANVNSGKCGRTKTPLFAAARSGTLEMVKYLVEKGANLNETNDERERPLSLARYNSPDVANYLKAKGARYRRSIGHVKSTTDKNKSTSGANKPLSLMNVVISAMGGYISATMGCLTNTIVDTARNAWQCTFSPYKLDEGSRLKEARTRSSRHYSVSRSNSGCSEKVSQNPSSLKSRMTLLEMGDRYLSQIDKNSTILLLDTVTRMITRQKHIFNDVVSVSGAKALGYAASITSRLEKVVEQAGLKSGVSMHRLNIDFMEVQKEVTKKIISGKFDDISGTLKLHIEKICPGRECSNRLSQEKFDKFMAEFKSLIDPVVNQWIQEILYRLEVGDIKVAQVNLKPKNYLNGTSTQGHLPLDRDLKNQNNILI